jgi:hypothetical protein
MNSACRVIAFGGFILTIGYCQNTNPTAAQLEAMERFASKPAAQVTWSKEVERIDTDQAHAVIIALILEDRTQTPRQMRGVRIDLTSANLKDQVYTSEELLSRLIHALDEISNGLPDFHSLPAPERSSCFGSGVFWQQSGHAFSASHCKSPDWFGLAVETGSASFRLTALDPSSFAAAIAHARDELKKH